VSVYIGGSNDAERNVVAGEEIYGFVGFCEIVGDYTDIGERLIRIAFVMRGKFQIALNVLP